MRSARIERAIHKAMEESNGEVVRATALLVEDVQSDEKLYRDVMDPLVRKACYDLLRDLHRQERKIIWESDFSTTDDHRSRIEALARGTVSSLMDLPLPSGKPLGDAYHDELVATSLFYTRQSNNMRVKGRFFALVAKRTPEGKIVRQVLSLDDLESLKREAQAR